MTAVRRLLVVSVCLVVVCLALSYVLVGLWVFAPSFVLLGIIWLRAAQRGQGGVSTVAFAVTLGAAALGMLQGGGSNWAAVTILLAVLAALSAWDLEDFAMRLKRAGRVAMAADMQSRHLRRLALVDGLGLAAGAAALLLRLRFSFGVALLAALLAVIAIGQVFRVLRARE
jgi:hypothetical protein